MIAKIDELTSTDTAKNAIAIGLAAWVAYSDMYPHTIFGQIGKLIALPLGVLFGIRSGGVAGNQPK